MDSVLREANRCLGQGYKDESFGVPKILIVGCGDAGNNTLNRLARIGLNGAETTAINTDSRRLAMTEANKKILIGRKLTHGLDVVGESEIGKMAAEIAKCSLHELLKGADLVFLTAGMGGGDGNRFSADRR